MNKNTAKRLFALASKLDEQGKIKEAEQVDAILRNDAKKRKVAKTLIEVADSLENKGAFKEAQMADTLMRELSDADSSDFDFQFEEETTLGDFDQQQTIEEPQLEVEPQLEIETPTEQEPEYDAISIDELRNLRDSSNLRFTQRHDREAYEQAIEKAEQAQKYKDAYEKWLDAAHKELGDRPIRINL